MLTWDSNCLNLSRARFAALLSGLPSVIPRSAAGLRPSPKSTRRHPAVIDNGAVSADHSGEFLLLSSDENVVPSAGTHECGKSDWLRRPHTGCCVFFSNLALLRSELQGPIATRPHARMQVMLSTAKCMLESPMHGVGAPTVARATALRAPAGFTEGAAQANASHHTVPSNLANLCLTEEPVHSAALCAVSG